MSNTYYVVFLLRFSSSGVAYVAFFSGLSIFDCPSVFSNVYLIKSHASIISVDNSMC